jgi:hypothetical protein
MKTTRGWRERSQTNRLIGHVVGFMHEHERHDARQWTKFDCRALNRFEETKQRNTSIESSAEPAFTQDMSLDSKMDLV